MLKDWDAFEKLPEIDQMLLLEALMGTALMMSHLGEWWIAERLVADPRCRQWAFGAEINQRMNNKPRLGFNALLGAVAEHTVRTFDCGN
ncbi:MAG: hypothetical protein U1E25_11825 [Methylocystis sp.]